MREREVEEIEREREVERGRVCNEREGGRERKSM